MMTGKILPILVWPDDKLNQPCKDVVNFDSGLAQLVADMQATMLNSNGVGLAGPQVGVLLNVIVLDPIGCSYLDNSTPLYGTVTALINPVCEKLDTLDKYTFNEGCLSVPGYFEDRERPNSIVVTYQDIKGNKHTEKFERLFAFAIQHEMDHLNGKVFVDGMSKLKQERVRKKIQKTLRFR